MGLLDHKELMIVKGIGPTTGDTASAEQPLTVVDFLSSAAGFSLADWSPNIPSLKNNGVWADSSISDGRTLIAGQNTNVVETITVQLTAANAKVFAAQFAALQRIIQDARAFWDTQYQIEPVYLRWWACGAPGPQFALIYNIDMDVEHDDSDQAAAKLTFSIEREFGWRGVRPGGNPKEWSLYRANSKLNASNATLMANSDHLVTDSVSNRREWASSAFAAVSTRNYIDVPASKIPGDLPALCCIGTTQTGSPFGNSFYLARKTTPVSLTARDGSTRLQALIMNAGDAATVIADTTQVGDVGAPLNKGGTAQRLRCTFATSAALVSRANWNISPTGIDPALIRGRYMVLGRARVSATATVTLRLSIGAGGGGGDFATSQITLTDLGAGGTGATSEWAMVNFGVLQIPLQSTTLVDPLGRGIQVATSLDNFDIFLDAARTAGSGELYFCDLILLPIDEAAAAIIPINTAGSGIVNYPIFIDSSGYFSHGRTDLYAGQYASLVSSESGFVQTFEVDGQFITLLPNVDNRLHFFFYKTSNKRSTVFDAADIRLNIVPRWSGIRDA